MAENQSSKIFRKQTLERISSPDRLTDYLHVTNPGIWVVLAAVIFLLAGILAWACVGTLETKAEVKVVVQDKTALIIPLGSEKLTEGMTLRVAGEDSSLNATENDEYGRSLGSAVVNLPDGTYNGIIVTESVHPIEFLMTSR